MIDKDLALLYGVETKRLNEQVKRNIERFPEDFMFQLRNICHTHSPKTASRCLAVNIKIMRTFTRIRKSVHQESNLLNRVEINPKCIRCRRLSYYFGQNTSEVTKVSVYLDIFPVGCTPRAFWGYFLTEVSRFHGKMLVLSHTSGVFWPIFDRGADTCNRYRGLYNLNLISTFARPHL